MLSKWVILYSDWQERCAVSRVFVQLLQYLLLEKPSQFFKTQLEGVIMVRHIRSFLLLSVGILFCVLGCTRDRGHILMPDHISSPMDAHESVDLEASFAQNLMPILTARCALAGCHVADGPHGLDFRTYESFIAGGAHGPAFIPGNAAESEIVEQIASGRMPPGGPPLSDAEIQHFVDWINQQEPQVDVIEHVDSHEPAIEKGIHEDMDDDHDDDMNDNHDGIDDDDNDDHNGDHDDDN